MIKYKVRYIVMAVIIVCNILIVDVQAKTHILTSIIVSNSYVKIVQGTSIPIKVTAVFSDGEKENIQQNVKWEVSNDKIADVENFKLTGLQEGVTRITASYKNHYADISVKIYSNLKVNGKSEMDIVDKWNKCTSFKGGPYIIKPNLKPPYSAGRINNNFLRDGLSMLDFVRYLANIPNDIVMDDELNKQAQYCAVLEYANYAATGDISHTPAQPKGMNSDFYQIGYDAAGSSNLVWNNVNSPARSIRDYMSDSDNSNIDSLGHRRWILNPQLKKVGFGYADEAGVLEILDQSRNDSFDYNFIAWPGSGYFPSGFLNGNDAWSITLNPNKYQSPNLKQVKVTLTQCSTNKKWTFDKSDNVLGKDGNAVTKNYFNVDNEGCGVPNCIIFRPNDNPEYKHGSIYKVSIDGIKDSSGKNANITYYVHFFDLE